MKADSVLQGHPESIHRISSPFGSVFVLGAQKEWNLMFEAVQPELWGEHHDA